MRISDWSSDVCSSDLATSNRQDAVKAIAGECDRMIVIGAPNSSNSLRLVEVAERLGTPAHLVQRGSDIDPAWLDNIATLGITAGASAPETLVREVIADVAENGRASWRGRVCQIEWLSVVAC